MRRLILAAVGLAVLSAGCATTPIPKTPTDPDAVPAATGQGSVDGAVAAADRPAADREKDAARRPAELLAFAGVKPGDTVVDVWPGGGYWTRIFSKIVGPTGKVYAFVPFEITAFKSDPMAAARKAAAELGNVEVVGAPLVQPFAPRSSVDVVWTFQNYHDLHNSYMAGADVAAFNKMIFTSVKPGGVFVIVDHAAAPKTGLAHTEDLHRIDPAQVKKEVEAAGFVLEATNPLLAHPEDPHTAGVTDESIRGKTDQFIYKFRKPG